MTESIAGKVIVITGASSGLGEATARLLSAGGAAVALGARRADRLKALANEIVEGGGKALVVSTDVTSREQVKALVEEAVQRFGRIDVTINIAGLMPQAPERLKVDEWDHMIDVKHQGRVVRNRRRAASHAAAEGRPFHQRVVGRRAPDRSRFRRLCGDEARRSRAVRGPSPGSQPYNIRTTVILPGAVATELPAGISDTETAERVRTFYSQVAVPADSFARVVAFAMSQPESVDINEILYRLNSQAF